MGVWAFCVETVSNLIGGYAETACYAQKPLSSKNNPMIPFTNTIPIKPKDQPNDTIYEHPFSGHTVHPRSPAGMLKGPTPAIMSPAPSGGHVKK